MIKKAWLFFCLGVSLAGAGSQTFADDLPGSRDLEGLERFPLSEIVFYSDTDAQDILLVSGSVAKVNNRLRLGNSLREDGQWTRLSYLIPAGHTVDEVYAFFKAQLKTTEQELLFECEGRGCGRSNIWANDIFKRAYLYGPDREQRYFILKRADDGGYLLLYTTMRGNRKVYAHLEQVSPASP